VPYQIEAWLSWSGKPRLPGRHGETDGKFWSPTPPRPPGFPCASREFFWYLGPKRSARVLVLGSISDDRSEPSLLKTARQQYPSVLQNAGRGSRTRPLLSADKSEGPRALLQQAAFGPLEVSSWNANGANTSRGRRQVASKARPWSLRLTGDFSPTAGAWVSSSVAWTGSRTPIGPDPNRDFLELVASQIATRIAIARDYQEEKRRAEEGKS